METLNIEKATQSVAEIIPIGSETQVENSFNQSNTQASKVVVPETSIGRDEPQKPEMKIKGSEVSVGYLLLPGDERVDVLEDKIEERSLPVAA